MVENYDGEIDLIGSLVRLWRFRWLIAGGTMLAALLAAVVTGVGQPAFVATARLQFTAPLDGRSLPAPPKLRKILASPAIGTAIVREFKLDGEPWRVSVDELIGERASIDIDRDNGTVSCSLRLPDPGLAAKVANRIAARSAEAFDQASREETLRVAAFRQRDYEIARARLQESEAAVSEYRQAHPAKRTGLTPGDRAESAGQGPEFTTRGVVRPSAALGRPPNEEPELSQLEWSREVAQGVFWDAAIQYEKARQATGQWGSLHLVEPAATPERPLARHTLRNAVLGGGLGFVLAAMLALLLDAFRSRPAGAAGRAAV